MCGAKFSYARKLQVEAKVNTIVMEFSRQQQEMMEC